MRHEELMFTGAGDGPGHDRRIQRAHADGQLIKIADSVYMTPSNTPPEEVVYRNWHKVLARFLPGCVLTGRSGIRCAPLREEGPDGRLSFPGWIYATHSLDQPTRKKLSLPGLEIRSMPGPGHLEGDTHYLGVIMPSLARQFLENLKFSRKREAGSPNIYAGQAEVEVLAERVLRDKGPAALVEHRDRAQRIAPALGLGRELAIFEKICGALLGDLSDDLSGDFLSKDVAARNRRNSPYDPECLGALKRLAQELAEGGLPQRPDPHVGVDKRECISFSEAYFSNYIEGTRFAVEKAVRIVFNGDRAEDRYKDGRDVVETYKQVVAMQLQTRAIGADETLATGASEFIDELRSRHAALMAARPEVRPGMFKVERNMAGNHVFVSPELVIGSLVEGFAMLRDIDHPLARGLFVHALSAMVHAFDDGNGRISRILMTKELVGRGHTRIVVPTIFRSDYIAGMRSLSRPGGDPGPYVRCLSRCQEATALVDSDDLRETIRLWAGANAFLEDERGAQLRLPDPARQVEWRDGIPAAKDYWDERDALSEEDNPLSPQSLSR